MTRRNYSVASALYQRFSTRPEKRVESPNVDQVALRPFHAVQCVTTALDFAQLELDGAPIDPISVVDR
jgi:hypothetical protein